MDGSGTGISITASVGNSFQEGSDPFQVLVDAIDAVDALYVLRVDPPDCAMASTALLHCAMASVASPALSLAPLAGR